MCVCLCVWGGVGGGAVPRSPDSLSRLSRQTKIISRVLAVYGPARPVRAYTLAPIAHAAHILPPSSPNPRGSPPPPPKS